MKESLKMLAPVLLTFSICATLASNLAMAQYVCQPAAGGSTTTGSLTLSDPTQAGRIVRDGIPSSCNGKTNSLQNTTAVHAKAYNFTNPTGQAACVTVDFNHTGCGSNSTEIVAYSTYTPATPNTGVIGDSGFSSTGVGSFSFRVTAGQSFTIVEHEIIANTGCTSFSFTVSYSTGCRVTGFDRTNDGKADPTVFRPSTGDWFMSNSAGAYSVENFGIANDVPFAADWTGDGQSDVGVYRTSSTIWYSSNSHPNPGQNLSARQFGSAGDVPLAADYDGDGKADISVFRPSTGTWFIFRSSDSTVQTAGWGKSGDVPFAVDFDGDRKADYGIYRPTDPSNANHATWYVLETNFNFGFILSSSWGLATDKPVPADYDGDGKADIAVWRPSDGNWYIANSGPAGGMQTVHWGVSGDVPQPADYDGDNKADVAVFRPSADPSQNYWYILRSSDQTFLPVKWGAPGDIPTTTAYTAP